MKKFTDCSSLPRKARKIKKRLHLKHIKHSRCKKEKSCVKELMCDAVPMLSSDCNKTQPSIEENDSYKHSASDNPFASYNEYLNPSPALEECSLAYLEDVDADLFSESDVLVGGKDKGDVEDGVSDSSSQWTISVPAGWVDQTEPDEGIIRLCKLLNLPVEDTNQPVIVHLCLTVNKGDGKWIIYSLDRQIHIDCNALHGFPVSLSPDMLLNFLSHLNKLSICKGNCDESFIALAMKRKGVFRDRSGKVVRARLESHVFYSDGQVLHNTIRTTSCEILLEQGGSSMCMVCRSYRPTLISLAKKVLNKDEECEATSTLSHTNWRYLTTPQRAERAKRRTSEVKGLRKANYLLKERIAQLAETDGVMVDEPLHSDLCSLMQEHHDTVMSTCKFGSFQHTFWKQQEEASRQLNARTMRWHPQVIRWCLHLRLKSSGAYHELRESGLLKLPSERTLRDYTYCVPPVPGFQEGVQAQLVQEAKLDSLEDWQKFVILTFDEMKIKEGLVYDKYTDKLVGFITVDDISHCLQKLEQTCSTSPASPPTLASHMLVLLVRGVTISLKFPLAQFPTDGIAASQMYPIITDAVMRLEKLGFKVICLTANGASPNRKLFRMLGAGCTDNTTDVPYKMKNVYTDEDRMMYFMSDVPHLLKTTRNCWANSGAHKRSRNLRINRKSISWQHLLTVYEANKGNQTDTPGLVLLPRVKYDHVHLNPYSKMRVDLAAQVLSSSVANALELMDDPAMSETVRFIRIFDRWFDCLNVSSLSEGKQSLKKDLYPYRTRADAHFHWLENDFLDYLTEWDKSAAEDAKKFNLEKTDKNKLCISRETIEGIRISVRAFVEMGRYLLSVPGMKFILSERFTQDPLESFFGHQRQRGGGRDNPTVHQFVQATQSIRVQHATAPLAGSNVRGSKHASDEQAIDTPLQKRV